MWNILKRFIGKLDRWSIGIYVGDSPFHLRPAENVVNPVLTAGDVTDRKAEFVADPFMIQEGDSWYMFFEVMDAKSQKADIGLAISRDGLRWAYERIVLSEPFHLSYPYVFLWEGVYYMIPESYFGHEIRLYKATEFPTKWSFLTTLVSGGFSDSSVFRYNDHWWMFTTGEEEGEFKNDILRLYHSVDLLGPWEEHPKSPVIKNDLHAARPGGRVLVLEDRIIRYAQDDYVVYGNQLRAFEIMKLSGFDYEEREIAGNPILKASGKGWNKDGMHHIDLHGHEGGRWIACVDGNARSFGIKGSRKI